MKWIFYYFLSHNMPTQMIPSLCIPHVDSRFSAEIISDTFNALFQADCVKDVQLKKKQFTYPNGKVRDFHLCFIHFKESEFSQDVLDSCLADLNGGDKHFVIKPYEDEDTFWKVFLAIKKTHKSPSPVLIRK